ncbi:MAG: type II toxin-antitoxin system RelE/ParE family toxin [Rudanella sp.]|nr:type II toxin-antitoxin system RelE/ParE family toxin [Rudanella sp.]
MALSVELSDRARQDIEQIAGYLSENWSEQVKLNFLVTLADKMRLIGQMPYLYKASRQEPSIRECVLTKHTVIFYRVTDQSVEIITIKGTRQRSGEF